MRPIPPPGAFTGTSMRRWGMPGASSTPTLRTPPRSPRWPIPTSSRSSRTPPAITNRVTIDLGYSGIADNDEEGQRLVRALGDKRRMMLGNHGVLVVAGTVAEAFDDLYYLERACQTQVSAYSTGQPLS